MDAPLALYRRYRPDDFRQVIGQEHVTAPLQQALRNNRVNHAYLFSGPRGCGKTTSARILARCLNCEQGPTAEPCGECQSCRDLACGGPGNIDVIEIDAASHGGVDDARELRERAFFSPVAARYKIYIVDEAHMVTPQGFNALLKLVEEPPDHLKFVFATTEPDKVIGTIRSRTHHYPFRLVPPKVLQDYLGELCGQEGVEVESGALPLVVRAGGGSVRDTLSVLDQLIAGAGTDGVTYAHAVSLLGYTPDALLDEMVDALADADGRTVFGVIDRVIESGQDPKRFGEDLLRRLRDLLIVAAVPDAPSDGLIDGPPELLERLGAQAERFGAAQLSRAAELVHAGLTDMRGATAPRLQLELICARALLPASDDTEHGMYARLERLERGAPPMPPVPSAHAPSAGPVPIAPRATATDPAPTSGSPTAPQAPRSTKPAGSPPRPTDEPAADTRPAVLQAASEPAASEPAPPESTPVSRPAPSPVEPSEPTAPRAVTPSPATSSEGVADAVPDAAGAGAAGSSRLGEVRDRWPQVLDAVMRKRRFTWILLSQNAHVVAVTGGTVTIGLVNAGARDSFARGGSEDILRQAMSEVLGGDWRIEAVVDPGTGPSGQGAGAGRRPGGGGADRGSSGGGGRPAGDPPKPMPEPSAPGSLGVSSPSGATQSDSWSSAVGENPPGSAPAGASVAELPPATAPPNARPDPGPERPAPPYPDEPPPPSEPPDDEVDRDHDSALTDDATESQAELLQREFGARVIDEPATGRRG